MKSMFASRRASFNFSQGTLTNFEDSFQGCLSGLFFYHCLRHSERRCFVSEECWRPVADKDSFAFVSAETSQTLPSRFARVCWLQPCGCTIRLTPRATAAASITFRLFSSALGFLLQNFTCPMWAPKLSDVSCSQNLQCLTCTI